MSHIGIEASELQRLRRITDPRKRAIETVYVLVKEGNAEREKLPSTNRYYDRSDHPETIQRAAMELGMSLSNFVEALDMLIITGLVVADRNNSDMRVMRLVMNRADWNY